MSTFKWPWVSRTLVELLERELERERSLHAATQAKLDSLIAAKEGGLIPPTLPVKEPDPVTLAILSKSHGNSALHRHYAAVVAERRAQRAVGLIVETEADLAQAILHGQDDDTGVPLA